MIDALSESTRGNGRLIFRPYTMQRLLAVVRLKRCNVDVTYGVIYNILYPFIKHNDIVIYLII